MYQKGVEAAIRKRINEIVKKYREAAVVNNIPFTEQHEEMVRNVAKDLLCDGIYPILSEYELNDIAYLVTDEEKLPCLITDINVSINGNTYEIAKDYNEKTVYEFELQKQRPVI